MWLSASICAADNHSGFISEHFAHVKTTTPANRFNGYGEKTFPCFVIIKNAGGNSITQLVFAQGKVF